MAPETRAPEAQPNPRRPVIWAMGGGKGGVGKSVITANLGLALARQGRRCVLVDADLGGANLHTMLGVPPPRTNLSALFQRDGAALAELAVATDHPNLFLISGSGAPLDLANPHYAHKQKFLRQLAGLDADMVLLDLSAGSSFNTLDFFLAGTASLCVVVPTPTSIENAYHFLKAAFYRKLKGAIARAGVGALVDEAMHDKVARGIRSPRDLLGLLRREQPRAGAAIAAELATVRPKLLVNQIRREEELLLGQQISGACRDYFGIDMEFLGGMRQDERVFLSIQMKRPVLEAYPFSPFAGAIEALALRLLALPAEVSHGTE